MKGYVDLQLGGYKGIDYSSDALTIENFRKTIDEMVSIGTEIFLPTIITNSPDIYEKNIPIILKVMKEKKYKRHIPGFHLEGPFISKKDGAVGAHNKKYVRPINKNDVDWLFGLCENKISILTIAPEGKNTPKMIEYIKKKYNCVISLGHHLATTKEIQLAVKAGATACTHLGNGIPAMLPRHPNQIWDQMSEDKLTAMFIGDGNHLPLSFIKTLIKAKGIDNCICISDQAPIAGLPVGKYKTSGNNVILKKDGSIHSFDSNTLCGSSKTITQCIKYLRSTGEFTEKELLCLCYHNPLKLIGLN
ncbi:MAG: hypothetical protein PHE88_05305 [Elusimicrobia bacterium]|nr:hypothetical protein [Elusimicrobiota bacterium]